MCVSTFTHANNSQVHRSINTIPFDLVLYWRLPDFALQSTMSIRNMRTATEQRVGFLVTLQHSSDHACASLQRTQQRYEWDIYRRPRRGLNSIRTGEYVFIDISDDVTKTPKLGHTVEWFYRMLGQNQHTVVIQHKKLVQRHTTERVARVLLPAGVLPILPESALLVDIQNKTLKGKPCLFHGIIYQYFNEKDQLKFLFHWVPIIRLYGSLTTTCGKERFSDILLVCVEHCRTGTNNHQKVSSQDTKTKRR